MDILLVNPPTLNRGITIKDLSRIGLKGDSLPYYQSLLAVDASMSDGFSTLPGEHLGLQSLQASLESAGHRTCIINACVELHTSVQKTLNRIKEYDFDLIGFTGPHDVFAENLWLARALRESGYTGHITLGHDFATLNHQLLLTLCPEFDSIIRGEGELTMIELATALESHQPLQSVQGLSFMEQSRLVINPSRPACNLDQLPWVTRPHLPAVLKLKMAPAIFTKRGCPYQCTFCTTGQVPLAENLRGKDKWRQRSPQHVVDEIEYLVTEYGIRWITIVDDLYLSKGRVGSQHAIEVAEELLNRKLDIKYMIDCRVDSIDEEVFSILKRSGLSKVFIGIESASEVALNTFRKGYNPEIIRKKLHILEKLDIKFIFGYIFFSPLDTLEGLEKSYQLLIDLNWRDIALFLQEVRIYPGTILHHNLEHLGLIEGEFPYFSSKYLNPYVNQLREMMNTFGSLAIPILHASYRLNGQDTAMIHERIYQLMRRFLGELIDCCKQGDNYGLDMTFQGMLEQFRQLVPHNLASHS